MSSTGQIVGGIVGAVVGYFVGNPVMGAQIGMTIGGIVDPPKVQGPRLEDLVAQTNTYGAFIPRVHGTVSLTGNVFWIQGDKLIEREAEDSGKGGPEVTNYEYFATFAVGLCEGPIAGIRRIWIGGQLWYDAGVDALPSAIASGLNRDTFTLYTGSETQLADPLIQADRGVANVPAYRGLAYIVFNELPVKPYGNSLAGAHVKVEVISIGSLVLPPATQVSSVDASIGLYDVYTGYLARLSAAGTFVQFYNPGSVADVGSLTLPAACANIVHGEPGTFWAIAESGDAYICEFSSMSILETVTKPANRKYGAWNAATNEMVLASSNLSYSITVFKKTGFPSTWTYTTYATVTSANAAWGSVTTTNDGRVVLTNGDKICVLDKYYAVLLNYQCSPSATDYLERRKYSTYDSKRDRVYVTSPGSSFLYVLDMTTSVPSVTAYAVDIGRDILYHIQSDLLIGVGYALAPVYQILDPDNLPVILDSFAVSGPVGYISGIPTEINGINDAVFVSDASAADGLFRVPFIRRIDSSTAILGDVVKAECLKSELLTAADLDVTQLTDPVRGYRISNLSPIRGGIDPLRKAWPFDVVQAGYKIKFVKRGGASVATISDSELDAREAGAEPGVQVTNTREMDTVLPNQLTVRYLDSAREYDVNVAEESR